VTAAKRLADAMTGKREDIITIPKIWYSRYKKTGKHVGIFRKKRLVAYLLAMLSRLFVFCDWMAITQFIDMMEHVVLVAEEVLQQ
jgi:hypothetical protein